MTTATTMPAVFIGHGSPMNTLEHNRYTECWNELGRNIDRTFGRPRAILCVSAHWFINATAVTAMAAPRTIHDFFGFPPELFAFEYAAPGDPQLAESLATIVDPMWVGLDHDSWGLDHGAWSVLCHLYPDADVPVVQLSVDASKPASHHFELGQRLAPLRDDGVLIVASGNIVHNLRMLDFSRGETGFDWAERFDTEVRDLMLAGDGAGLVGLDRHPDYRRAVPTTDHFWPVLYLGGLADASGEKGSVVIGGYGLGSLSMTSIAIGM